MNARPEMQFDLKDVDPDRLHQLSDEQFRWLMSQAVDLQAADRKENQLLYYEPASPEARKVHQSKARWLGIGGGNGSCVPLHAPVMMADGTYKPLGEIRVGERVMAADPVSGKAVPANVKTVFRSGLKPVYRITFSDGGSFEATAEHQVPLYLGSAHKTDKGHKKLPHKRRLGDYIEPIIRRGAGRACKRISAVSPGDIRTQGNPILGMDPWFLGALLGDGGISQNAVKFYNKDPEVIERARTCAISAGDELRKWSGPIEYGVVGGNTARALRCLGVMGKNSYGKFIPAAVFAAAREVRAQVLAGLIDTDGTADQFISVSRELAEGVAQLVRSLGGKATISSKLARCQNGGQSEAYSVYLRVNETLPLSLPRKQNPGQRGREIDYGRRVCRTAELTGAFECGDIEVDHPAHCYITGDNVIVSNSKTDTCMADIIACCTGIIPLSTPEIRERFRGPISARIVVQSLSNTLHTVILPKLQWWRWSGIKPMGGDKGHWGWVPKLSLIDADWERSWSEKLRVLRMLCRDPENPDKVLGESFIQFCSHDQDPQDLASGDYEIVLHDEPTKFAIWAENKARTMRVNGRMFMAMTWPDDPAIPVDWIFDELYEPGSPGPNKSPEHEWIELSTRNNRNLDQRSVSINARSMDEAQRKTRIEGLPIRFSNRIHPLFTDRADFWSFAAGKTVFPAKNDFGQDCCPETGSTEIVEFTHVRDNEPSRLFPTVFILDPHPRKPHMFMWVQIDPSDDYCCVLEDSIDGSPDEVADLVRRTEEAYGLYVVMRIMDPNMGKQPSTAGRREMSWVDEFAEAGLTCDLASDSDVGRSRINEYLQPDEYTLKPRLTISNACTTTIFQMKRYCWDEHKRAAERDLKQVAKAKNDDYPTMLKYLMNAMPSFRQLMDGPRRLQREGMRPGGGYGGRPRHG